MNNSPKVVAQQRRGRASNPRLLDRKSDFTTFSGHCVHMYIHTQCTTLCGEYISEEYIDAEPYIFSILCHLCLWGF